MMLSGVMSLISTILSFAMLSVLLSSRKCCSASVLLLKKFLPVVIWNMNTASMFMPNPTVVTLRLLPNILAGILVALSLPLPGSILIPVILSLSITIVTKMINTFKETIPVMDFIKRLIRHIPEKHFKMIRYGGLYARHRSLIKTPSRYFEEKRHTFRCFNRWRTAILSSFGYDPLICPHCKQQMVILEIYHHHRRVPLEELYEKAMSRSRGKRSSA